MVGMSTCTVRTANCSMGFILWEFTLGKVLQTGSLARFQYPQSTHQLC